VACQCAELRTVQSSGRCSSPSAERCAHDSVPSSSSACPSVGLAYTHQPPSSHTRGIPRRQAVSFVSSPSLFLFASRQFGGAESCQTRRSVEAERARLVLDPPQTTVQRGPLLCYDIDLSGFGPCMVCQRVSPERTVTALMCSIMMRKG
jgi:hypothetical protein